jgi:hypothetical protein
MRAIDFKSTIEIAEALKDTPASELREMIVSMAALEPLFTAPQIAAREGVKVRDVRKAMNAGEFVHPLLGPGFFCRGPNSKKVAASAVNRWRAGFFKKVAKPGRKK